MCKRNGALSSVAMNDALMNTVRLFEAFDFMSLTQAWPRTHNTLSMSAFDVWRLRGTTRAFKPGDAEKIRKTDRQGLAGANASENDEIGRLLESILRIPQ